MKARFRRRQREPRHHPAVLSGRKTNAPHAMASRKTIAQGELVLVDCSGVYKRYHANMARTFAMGEPKKDVIEIARKSVRSV
ncbi:MAG: M24 family metallopeptidase [Alphaproteobacteria bacterium]|nr:M24 family metallopeptidase [Alphaproteobacteria bacterium]